MTPAAFSTYMESIATKHADINFYVYGSIQHLQNEWSKNNKGNTAMFVEFPVLRPRDEGGSFDARHITGVSILKSVKSGDFDAERAAFSSCFEIIVEVMKRIRYDAKPNAYSFYINNIQEVQPVMYYTIENAFGARMEIEFGDWERIGPTAAKWSDL